MTLTTTIARSYAKAAFEFALQKNQLDAWQTQLQKLAGFIVDPIMQNFIHNPKVSPDQISAVILDLWKNQIPEQENFARILIDNNKLPALPEIIRLFAEFVANK